MRTRQSFIAVLVVALVGLVGVSPAGAEEQTNCTIDFLNNVAPGLGTEPSSGVYHSDRATGVIECEDGRKGKYEVDGRYGTKDPDSCTSGGEGWGVSWFTLGDKTYQSTYTVEFAGLKGGLIRGTYEGELLSGDFTFTPTKGDCVTSAATQGRVQGTGILQG